MVAACVMTFEARDRAAKFMSNQLKIMGGGVGGGIGVGIGGGGGGGGTTMSSGHRGHGRQTPSVGYLSRGDSGRSSYQNPGDVGRQKMNKSPSAPNLVAVNRGTGTALGTGRLPFRHKHAVHVLSPGGGRALLSPHTLRRQAMSMDTQDYNPFFSPPRSRHSSSGLLTCNNGNVNNFGGTNNNSGGGGGGVNDNNINKQGSCSRESVNDSRTRGSRGSMVLDLHVPNECPVTMRVRDRSRRSDTARRHVLRRQTPVELDDVIVAYAASATAEHRQRAKRCTRSVTCDVPSSPAHAAITSKRRRQDSSCSDVIARRRSGSPVCGGVGMRGNGGGGDGGGGCWRSSANDVVDTAEWVRRASCISGGSAVSSSPRRVTAERRQRTAVHRKCSPATTTQNTVDSKMSLSRTCSDIVSIDKSFEESNYSSS